MQACCYVWRPGSYGDANSQARNPPHQEVLIMGMPVRSRGHDSQAAHPTVTECCGNPMFARLSMNFCHTCIAICIAVQFTNVRMCIQGTQQYTAPFTCPTTRLPFRGITDQSKLLMMAVFTAMQLCTVHAPVSDFQNIFR
jgi:hypothetical protein